MHMINAVLLRQHNTKRHMKFLTPTPNFSGVSWPLWRGFPEPLTPTELQTAFIRH